MVGVRGAGTVLAINRDPDCFVHEFADVSVIGDWREVVPPSSTSFGSTAGRAAPGVPSEPDTDVSLGDGP